MPYICFVATNRCIGKSPEYSTIGCRCPPASGYQSPSQAQGYNRYQGPTEAVEIHTILAISASASESNWIGRCIRSNDWPIWPRHVIGHRSWANHRCSYTRYAIGYCISRITNDEFTKKLSLSSALTNFRVEDIPSANPADQSMIQTTSSSQRQEIALKQVRHLT